ncbi:putative cytosol aminopeptidase [Betaproteobacteria bacterium]|nr:putative cytosol aminopeptidase [Betaproteobacteria bacterium]
MIIDTFDIFDIFDPKQEKLVEFSIKSRNPEKRRSACLVLGVFESHSESVLAPADWQAGQETRRYLAEVLKSGDMDGKAGSTLMLRNVPALGSERLLLVGLGKEKEFHEKAYGAAIRAAVKAIRGSGATDATLLLTRIPVKKRSAAWRIRQAAALACETLYRFDRFKSKKDDERPLGSLVFAVEDKTGESAAAQALAQGLAIGEGVALARTLGNLPGNVCTPAYLAETALQLAEEYEFDCRILEQADMETLGMHSLLSVAKGSRQPPRLIVAQYCGGQAGEKPIVLVGKGVTFDSGGISLKPGEGMDEMKFDMCGAASALGTLKAAAQMQLPLNLTVIAPCVENLPGGAASKPGDIVTSLSGQTIEILNTDAEGRLILCDALSYAERFKPAAVIDIATLTGACVIALGHIATGLFANDDGLAGELLDAGDRAFDRVWRLPLWDDYQEQIKSNFADMANVGGRPAGSITAACFLSRFAGKFAWAHLDIAGTAWKSGVDKGATGRPVPLLTNFLLSRAGKPR